MAKTNFRATVVIGEALAPVGDGTPDSWGRGPMRRGERRSLTELDYLVGVDDRTRQGALRYLDAAGRPLAHWG